MAKTDRRADRGVTRAEFDAVTHKIEQCCNDLELQFKRIAQIQAELDHIRAAWTRPKRDR